jgi:hypothetical protein
MLTRESVQAASHAAAESIQALLEEVTAEVVAEGTRADDLDGALEVQGDVDDAIAAITAKLDELHVAVSKRTEQIRTSAASHTLDRVADLVKSGHLALSDLLARLGYQPPVVAVAAAAPTAGTTPAPVASPAAALVPPIAKSGIAKRPVSKLPPMYAHPTSGESWTGRGPVPKWLKELAVDGKTRADFRVKVESAAGAAGGAASVADQPSSQSVEQSPAASTPQEGARVAGALDTDTDTDTDTDIDIGESVSFDGAIDDDIGDAITPAANDGDIGEMFEALSEPGTEIRLFTMPAAALAA